jgi:hypothetical protein
MDLLFIESLLKAKPPKPTASGFVRQFSASTRDERE